MNDLFGPAKPGRARDEYSAKDIEVLEGLEPVRRHPGMYIGGTDEAALHHLPAEILDNAIDEAIAGHASTIEVMLQRDNWLTVRDNGRGIPVDPHPRFKPLSALEVDSHHPAFRRQIRRKGLCDVGRPARRRQLGGQRPVRTDGGRGRAGAGAVEAALCPRQAGGASSSTLGPVQNRRGTSIRFRPDPEIFGEQKFIPARLYRLCRSKAYLVRGVEIRWSCEPGLLGGKSDTPAEAALHFPGGLRDSLAEDIAEASRVMPEIWSGEADLPTKPDGAPTGRLEWALIWLEAGTAEDAGGFLHLYCNTIPNPLGGTHEVGFRAALLKGLRAWAASTRGNRRATQLQAEDVLGALAAKLSVFLREPQLQGQTKRKADQSPRRPGWSRPRCATGSTISSPAIQPWPTICWLTRSSAPRNGSAGGRPARPRARARRGGCASPASSPTAPARMPRRRKSSWSRAIPPAARPSRRAIAKPRPCCRCGGKS